ncbi:MAG: putative RDD family membrane protein YckC, partial [Myxococcota bacterium]
MSDSPGRRSRRLIELVTPEHVPVRMELGDLSARAAALLIDGALILAAVVAVWMVSWFLLPGADIAEAVAIVSSFFLRSFYFAGLELRLQGQTVGKKVLGLQVVSRDGGPLTAEMVVARNLTRELELFVPLLILLEPAALGDLPGIAQLGTFVWMSILLILPALNHHRARVGDLLGGTMVVRTPKSTLLRDLIERDRPTGYTFTAEQLDLYGIKELQVLETILRDRTHDEVLLDDVASRICLKLEIVDEVKSRAFL